MERTDACKIDSCREPQQETWWHQGLKVKPRMFYVTQVAPPLLFCSPSCFCNLWPCQPQVNPSSQRCSFFLIASFSDMFKVLVWCLLLVCFPPLILLKERFLSVQVMLPWSLSGQPLRRQHQHSFIPSVKTVAGVGKDNKRLEVFTVLKLGSSLSENWSFLSS